VIKNVAFFLPHFGSGGAEGVVLKVIQGMDRNRFQPALILQKDRGEFLQYLPKDVPVTTLPRPRLPGAIASLSKLCTQMETDLLVTVTNAANLYAIASAALPASNYATLVMEHTPPSAFLEEAKQRALRLAAMRLLFPKADLTGGPLDQIGADLKTYLGSKAPPFKRLPNPVIEGVKSLKPIAAVAKTVVSVGRLSPEKRFDLLIDAFAFAYRDRPDIRLTIFGEGAERAGLEAQIARAGLDGVVSLPGFVDDMDLAHQDSDVFVCTSRREGLGNAIIEAMARGVPVLSVDCPFGPRMLLQDGAAGCLIEEHDAASIAAALLSFLADKGWRQEAADQAMQGISDYDVAHSVAAYEDAFDQAMALRDAR